MNIGTTVMYLTEKMLMSFHFTINMTTEIELTDEGIPSQNKIYSLSDYKFQKMKEYIAENLKKDFIEFSKVFYFVPILFTLKINRDF